MAYVYSILGAGRQGTAAAYDLGLRGEASEIRLIDDDLERARGAAERVQRLLVQHRGAAPAPPPALRALRVDVRDRAALVGAISGSGAVLSAVPYRFNVEAATAAIEARCHFNDLGGNTGVVREELALAPRAEAAGISIVPDCGLAPGMSQTLAVFAMSRVERPRHVKIRCGGLPQKPRPPLGYMLVFNVAGLTNEYTGQAVVIRAGKVVELPAFTEPEEIEFPMPVGRCQAFLTSGGTSTAPWTFEGKLETYDYKTVRYEGHYDRVRSLIDLGFLDTAPVTLGGQRVVPRELTHALFEKALWFPDDTDLVVLRVECSGEGASGSYVPGAFAGYRIDILDFQDPATGFTAMERTTAFPAAIVSCLQASGAIAAGAHSVETGVPAERFVSLLDRRGFKIVHSRF